MRVRSGISALPDQRLANRHDVVMTVMPLASFLAGSILSLLLPVLLLIGLVVWYVIAVKKVGGRDRTQPVGAAIASADSTAASPSAPPAQRTVQGASGPEQS